MEMVVSSWYLELLQWGKYVQYYPVDSYIDFYNKVIVVQLGNKVLKSQPFSDFTQFHTDGLSPEEAIETFIHNEYNRTAPGKSGCDC